MSRGYTQRAEPPLEGVAATDLREIYSYIANELLVPETAAAQLGGHTKGSSFIGFYASSLYVS